MPSRDPEHDYDVQLGALVNQLHHIAETVRTSGEAWRDPTRKVDRVECAMFIRGAIFARPSLIQTVDRLLIAAMKAEHPTAHLTPAQLLDRAATALEGSDRWVHGPDPETVAETVLRGAGVIR